MFLIQTTHIRVFGRLCLLAPVCHKLCNDRRQAGSTRDVFGAVCTEMNPARIEAIDHLGARLGPAFRHALADEEFRPLLTRDGNRVDRHERVRDRLRWVNSQSVA